MSDEIVFAMDNVIKKSVNTNIPSIISHAKNTVENDIYKYNKKFYSKYQWIAALCSRTCPVCANLDNQLFDLLPNMEGEGTRVPDTPHLNCRCFTVPVLEGDEEAATSQINYKDWFDRQDYQTKLDILGASRYKAYNDGMEIKQFVSNDRVLTLNELGVERTTRLELYEKGIINKSALTLKQQAGLLFEEHFKENIPKTLKAFDEYVKKTIGLNLRKPNDRNKYNELKSLWESRK